MVDGNLAELTDRIAEAVIGVSGVAFLRPGLGGLLRATAAARVTDRMAFERKRSRSAVRLRRGSAPGSLAVEVGVVLWRGHRAVDVTRAVRAAVQRAVRIAAGDGTRVQVQVQVKVTGLV
ncbi:Asp23/Gls24 family envelope stress response protein [Streptomyces sp. S.PB5]|uniref:Asp23/Gls24 family envelope stress response protein n=1 Tax=Streptomyces sp. S.PB5 TaxID=3020844 RepID=UPI0025B0BAB1|nr:Asp23/Gls24 family envelope stress response protein [Streptomyces sp. S.PB5]MDN3026024.1 Asp23/Gls24 family envelope stress response protein [Streptomyces sp. S.PB5]